MILLALNELIHNTTTKRPLTLRVSCWMMVDLQRGAGTKEK